MKLAEIAEFLQGNLNGDPGIEILRAAAAAAAGENEIGFLEKPENSASTAAACLIVPENFDAAALSIPTIKVKNPKLAFAKIAARLHPFKWRSDRHKTAIVAENTDVRASFVGAYVTIGENTNIGEGSQILEGVRIGDNVSIGKRSIIHPNCVIYDNVSIGDDCVIHAGAIIGADGFGYVRDGTAGYVRFPQIGSVSIGDGVEIGAHTCVDRGALGATVIGDGTKIDNLVQIAHNVRIGKRVVIAAQTGISGSTVIEDDCVIGGQVGFGDHATVKSGAVIGSQAGVLPGKIVRPGVWWGTPVQALEDYKRQNAHVKGLARLKEEVKELKRKIADLSD